MSHRCPYWEDGKRCLDWHEHKFDVELPTPNVTTDWNKARDSLSCLLHGSPTDTVSVSRENIVAAFAEVERLSAENATHRALSLLQPKDMSYEQRSEFERLKRADVEQGRRVAELTAETTRLKQALGEMSSECMRHREVASLASRYVDDHNQRSDDPDFTELMRGVEAWRIENERLLKIERAQIKAESKPSSTKEHGHNGE